MIKFVTELFGNFTDVNFVVSLHVKGSNDHEIQLYFILNNRMLSFVGSITRNIWGLLAHSMGAEMCYNSYDDKIRRKIKGM